MKKIKEFLNNVKSQVLTEQDILSFLLSLNNEEFIKMISKEIDNDKTGKPDTDIERMTQNNASIISEIISDLTLEEKLKALSIISNDFYTIEQMIYKTLPLDKATELFLDNPNKYKEEITAYIETPRQSIEKDHLIARILSNPDLYKLFSEEDHLIFKNLLSNKQIILDDKYNFYNVTYDEIKNEVARYLANIEMRKNTNTNLGIHQKISSVDLYQVYKEVNKGLKNIDEPLLTEEKVIEYLELPFEKAVLFLNQSTIKKEKISSILLNKYPTYKDLISKKNITDLSNIVLDLDIPKIDKQKYLGEII
ncbi:MAG: hypothetical protein ACI4XM_08405 [Candidatus Coprovivens sp.]